MVIVKNKTLSKSTIMVWSDSRLIKKAVYMKCVMIYI